MSNDAYIPLIDYTKPDNEIAEELFCALSTVGYAVFTGTGLCQRVREYSRMATQFFHLTHEEKEKYRFTPDKKSVGGWFTGESYLIVKDKPADFREGFQVRLKGKEYYQSQPADVLGPHCWELWDSFAEVSQRITYLIALGLKLEDPLLLSKSHNFSEMENNLSAMRINWYPPVDLNTKVEEGQMRIAEHTDYGTLTLLHADSPGLQVLNPSTGEFEDTHYCEDGLFVNSGDLLQQWTGDKLFAAKHRVRLPTEEKFCKERTSVVFACFPDKNTILEPLDGSAL